MLKITPNNEAIDFFKNEVELILSNIDKRYCTSKGIKHRLDKKVVKFIDENKSDIIEGKPNVLKCLITKYDNLNLSDDEKKSTKIIFEYVYEKYFQKPFGKIFLNKLNIDTCIYCNRNYTLDFKNLSNSRAQLDHWFPKADFPILALSFYNLIPSCQSCNHIKLNNSPIGGWDKALENINHPYFDKNDFKFSWFFDGNLNNTEVEIKVESQSKADKTLTFNKTKEIYNTHSNKELNDLLDLRYKYSDNYIKILIDDTFDKKLKMSKEEIYRMIFGIETKEEDYHKRPFSKFKHDIIEELKNIK